MLDGGHVHHPQIVAQHLAVRQLLVADGVRVLLGVVAVDAVDLGRLQQDVGLQLAGPQGGGGVGGHERVAGAAGEDDDAALLQVADGSGGGCTARPPLHADGRLQPRLAAEALQGVLQGQAVEDGGEHAHVVGGRLLDDVAAGGELGAAEDVAAADDDGELHALCGDALQLAGDVERLVDADAALAAGAERLAAELEQHAAVLRRGGRSGPGRKHRS